jgi:DNA-binding beta-propeller fold protein YncE
MANKLFIITTALAVLSPIAAFAEGGVVLTLSNNASANTIISFERHRDGTLSRGRIFGTHGKGTGAGLGSQGAISISKDGKYVIVVNAGSNSICLFKKTDQDLQFLAVENSGGVAPVSVTQSDRFVYVLNAGDGSHPNNLQEFVIYHDRLEKIADGVAALSGPGVAPAQVSFTPNGEGLIVTEKATNRIDSISLDWFDRPIITFSQPSVGQTPYGFSFGPQSTLLVSEAFGGNANASALSSYRISSDLSLAPITKSAPTGQTAACWTATSPDGAYVYTSNTGSGNVSGFFITPGSGSVSLLSSNGVSAVVGGAAIDSAFSHSGRFFYVLSAGTNTISEFEVWPDGTLIGLGTVEDLPAGSVGLAAE